MQTQIDHLPFAYQKLLAEFKAEKDALEASELDYVKHPVSNDKHEFEQLDSVIDSETLMIFTMNKMKIHMMYEFVFLLICEMFE